MPVGWHICRPAERPEPRLPRVGRLILAAMVLVGLTACTTTVIDVAPATSQPGVIDSGVPLGNPGTLVPPSQPGLDAPQLLAIEPLIAFMDACIADEGLVGPCHCAADRIEPNLTPLDLEVLEDRMSGTLEFSPELAGALVDCREAAAPAGWSDSQQKAYLDACSAGSDRLGSLCACSLARAQDVVPAHRLGDFLASNEVRPDTVDFINLCL